MRESILSIRRSIHTLEELCKEERESIDVAIKNKATELDLRLLFRCIPGDRLKESQLVDFLETILGAPPSTQLVERLAETNRGGRPTEAEYSKLEERQNYRCALCGRPLNADAAPQVDHIIPIAFRGAHSVQNFQILCSECNQGKGDNLHWLMAAPFFRVCREKVSFKMRYCVLSRDEAQCTISNCGETSRTSALTVVPKVPVQKGGRLIFDNLRTVCISHATDISQELFESASMGLRAIRFGLQ